MSTVLDQMKSIGIIPVVVLDDAKDAVALGKALVEGGLHEAVYEEEEAAEAEEEKPE